MVLACLLVIGAASGVGLADGRDRSLGSEIEGETVLEQDSAQAQQNNSTTQHEDPETVDEAGDTQRVRSYLIASMARQLQGSTVNLSQGEYERARTLVGEQYREDLGKYVDVAGDTEESATTRTLSRTQERQRRYINRTQSYRETKAEYQEAVEEGNETRARELARELARTAQRVNESGSELVASYNALENRTGVDLSEEEAIIEATTRNITADAATITRMRFTRTRLSLSISNRSVSFLDPAILSGQIVTENGTPLANRQLTVSIDGTTTRVDTNASGVFTTQYRPTRTPIDRDRLAVSYEPANGTVYLGSNASVPVDIQQVTARTTLSGPDTVAYGDTVTVSGRIAAEGVPVAGVPVRVVLGDVVLGTVRTNASGGYTVVTSLPASVLPGSRSLTAALALSERAVTSPPVSGSTTVVSTPTRLRVNTSSTGSGAGRVSGRLETVEGVAVPEQSVELRVNGSIVATVETDEAGRFAATLDRASVPAASTVTVAAVFDGTGTNLESATAESTLSFAAGTGSDGPGSNGNAEASEGSIGGTGPTGVVGLPGMVLGVSPAVLLVGLGLLTVASLGAAVVLLRNGGASTDSTAASTEEPVSEASSDDDPTAEESPLADAERHLENDPSVAVELAFATIRDELEDRFEVPAAATHREFARGCRSGGLPESAADTLDDLTDVYERAAFSPVDIASEDARAALENARSLLK
ncbi:hypothetical protein [Halobaculum sp. EA56]|uniref:DUF4129 domain-containing protein n=1 Tax=Halobaculum sp. EA56 TaxID=3421648 RepID=UPI003EC018DD